MSYVLTTRNKLSYLKEVVGRLLDHVRPDEEIVVVDGASTDGTPEYLGKLHGAGRIHQFISEPDVCQAHGSNKGLLMARGNILKILTDDDVFHYPGIQMCKRFMLAHPEIDMLNGNTADSRTDSPETVVLRAALQRHFEEWAEGRRHAFWFGDQSLFIRRRMLPLIGLWHTGVACIDVEKSVRITSQRQVNLAWYTGVLTCALYNPNSLTFSPGHAAANDRDVQRIFDFYAPASTEDKPSQLFVALREVRRLVGIRRRLRRLGRTLQGSGRTAKDAAAGGEAASPAGRERSVAEAFAICEDWLDRHHEAHGSGEFLLSENGRCVASPGT